TERSLHIVTVFMPTTKKNVCDCGTSPAVVFRVEVLYNGRKHFILKRHNEFHALHKKLKKILHTPDFPGKRGSNWRQKPLEQRRQELEEYIQGVLQSNEEVPQEMLDFLRVRHFPSVNKTYSLESLSDLPTDDYSCRLLHQRVVGFSKDPYILASSTDFLPNIIVDGVLQGLYPRDVKVSFTLCTKPSSPG
uniref:Sorting nexin 22 n=1 Tax=Lepisosteus oculatus TaxID=7918 RepID=W5NCW1_LEPOC